MTVVAQLLRYPLKSAGGERLQAVDVDGDGVYGDRRWACLDADGTVGSAKHPGRWAALLDVSVRLTSQHCLLRVAGHQVVAGTGQADDALSRLVGRPVRLTSHVPQHPRLHRLQPDDAGLLPDWSAGSSPGAESVTAVAGAHPGGRFLDFGAVHVVTTGALAALAARLGRRAVDPVRFRPNLVLDLPQDPAPGERLQLGDVVLQVSLPTPRCIVPGLTAPTGDLDPQLLAELARSNRRQVSDLGRAACFGVYADVVRPGRLQAG